MKINEIKLTEYDWLSLLQGVNNAGSAYLSKGGGQGKLTQSIFLKDFMNDAVNGLDGAIQSGLVDPQKSEVAVATAADFAPITPKAQQGDIGDYNLKDKLAQQQAQQTQAAKNKAASDAAQAKVNRAAAAPTSPAASAAVDARLARAQQAKTTSPTSVSNKLDTATAQRNVPPSSQPNLPKVRESYEHFNNLVESLLKEDDSAQSIETWMTNFFTRHMRNVNLTGKEQIIKAKAKEVANAVKTSKGNLRSPAVLKALQNMGNLAYSISMSDVPATATTAQAAAPAATKQQAAPATTRQQATTATKVAAPAQQVQPQANADVESALKGMGYKPNEIKKVLSKIPAGTDTETSVRQALQMLGGGKPEPETPEAMAGRILKNIDRLKAKHPDTYKELIDIITFEFPKPEPEPEPEPAPAANDELARARAAKAAGQK